MLDLDRTAGTTTEFLTRIGRPTASTRLFFNFWIIFVQIATLGGQVGLKTSTTTTTITRRGVLMSTWTPGSHGMQDLAGRSTNVLNE
jgi:hypothetical protein